MLSKEAYKYEFDQLGNWTKMSISIAVYENGKINFEPTGITYRAISYYYNQAIEKLNTISPKAREAVAPSTSSTPRPTSNGSATDSPRPSTPTAQVRTPIQSVSEAENVNAKKELVTARASITPAKSSNEAPESLVAASSENRPTSEEGTATNVVRHVSEDVLRNAARELPKPEYSDAALLARASGKVEVQVLVDENGLVTNARAISGHPLLGAAAEAAARKARFSLGKGPAKVYGVITYNFVPPTPVSEAFLPASSAVDKTQPKTDDPKPEAKPIPEGAALIESKPKTSAEYMEAAKAFYNQGVTSQASGRHAEAAEAFNQAIRINPNDANAYARLGMAYSALQKHKDAIVVYKMAHQTDRNVLGAPAYYMWGHSYLALDKSSDALSAFEQALYITRSESIDLEGKETPRYPSLEQLHYGMGIAYLNSRRFAKSIDELKQVVTLNPKHAEAHFALAIAYLSKGNRREAENQQKTLSSLDAALAKRIAAALTGDGIPPRCKTIACR